MDNKKNFWNSLKRNGFSRRLPMGILIVSLLLGSCKMQKIMVDVYTPAPLDFPPEAKNFVIASRYVPATGPYDDVKWGHYQTLDSAKLKLSQACLSAFYTEFISYDKFNAVTPAGIRMFKHNGDSLPEPLPWNGVSQIVKSYRADGIALMEGFDIRQGEISLSDDNGAVKAQQTVFVTMAWRVLQPERRRTLDTKHLTVEKVFESQGETQEQALNGLPTDTVQFQEAASFAGRSYAQTMKPGKQQVKRNYYVKGHPVLEETVQYVVEERWNKAEQNWKKQVYEGETDEVKAMCSFNMALLAEAKGFLNQALGYARRAHKLMPAKAHLDYINELNARVLELEDQLKAGAFIRNW